MSLIRVYHDLPDGSVTPYSPWYRTKAVTGDTPLDLYGDTPLYWRGVYSSDCWLDNNHIGPDGIGWVSLMAIAQNGCRGGASGVIGDRPYNLIGGEFRVSVGCVSSSLRLGPGVSLHFWVQCRDPEAEQGKGAYINLGYLRRTVDRVLGFTAPFERTGQETKSTSGFTELVVTFDPSRHDQWLPYGTSAEDAAKYGNAASLAQAFEEWDLNMGIHAHYGQTAPTSGDLPFGHLNIRNLSLWVDSALNPGAIAV